MTVVVTRRTTRVYIFTHGDKHTGPNPGMNENGFKQVKSLMSHLPAELGEVVSGTGRRHLDVAKALELIPTRITYTVGNPDSLETVNKEKVILLADGTPIKRDFYTGLTDGEDAMKRTICSLPDQSVVTAGRPSVIMLGVHETDAKSAAVYKVSVAHLAGNDFIEKIELIAAYGEAEIGTV